MADPALSHVETSPAAAPRSCPNCAARQTAPVLDLGEMAYANAYVENTPKACAEETKAPLSVRFCPACLLVHVAQQAPAQELFTPQYAYYSSYSSSWLAQSQNFANQMRRKLALNESSFVVEVGSNDGYLLQHFVSAGVPCLGVDPAAYCAQVASDKGVETEIAFFGREVAQKIRAEHRQADLIVAANVLAHCPEPSDLIAGVAALLAENGVAVFEFPHLLNLVAGAQFDTIYHEHFYYLSLLAVEKMLVSHGLRVTDVEMLHTHGGSLRVYAARSGAAASETPAVEMIRNAERSANLHMPEGYVAMLPRALEIRDGFQKFLQKAKAEHALVAGYGAAAKGSTFLQYCGVGPQDMAFIADNNPAKQNKLLPGAHIPIVSAAMLKARRPNYVVVLPWNLRGEVIREHSYISEWGGKFVIATPSVQIIEP